MLIAKTVQFFTQRFRSIILMCIVSFVAIQILFFSPNALDSDKKKIAAFELDPEILSHNFEEDRIDFQLSGKKIPEYNINDFEYNSAQKGVRQWKMTADKAILYHQENLILGRKINAFLYNPDGTFTHILGNLAKYNTEIKELEVFGDTETEFPDGFKVYSQYVKYFPQIRNIDIPTKYPTSGTGRDETNKIIEFTSMGFKFDMENNNILLPHQVNVKIQSEKSSETTNISSDVCEIFRNEKNAYFSMNSTKPLDEQYVVITQPSLFVKSRKAHFSYGRSTLSTEKQSGNEKNSIDSLIAEDDVYLEEENQGLDQRYGTSGIARFVSSKNQIILEKFPQLYQNQDTITGEVIILHRDTDLVEVKNSNAYNQGNSPKAK